MTLHTNWQFDIEPGSDLDEMITRLKSMRGQFKGPVKVKRFNGYGLDDAGRKDVRMILTGEKIWPDTPAPEPEPEEETPHFNVIPAPFPVERVVGKAWDYSWVDAEGREHRVAQYHSDVDIADVAATWMPMSEGLRNWRFEISLEWWSKLQIEVSGIPMPTATPEPEPAEPVTHVWVWNDVPKTWAQQVFQRGVYATRFGAMDAAEADGGESESGWRRSVSNPDLWTRNYKGLYRTIRRMELGA